MTTQHEEDQRAFEEWLCTGAPIGMFSWDAWEGALSWERSRQDEKLKIACEALEYYSNKHDEWCAYYCEPGEKCDFTVSVKAKDTLEKIKSLEETHL